MIEAEEVRNIFDYHDGRLFWRRRPRSQFATYNAYRTWNARYSGKEAGSLNGKKYLHIGLTFKGKRFHYKAHRLVWAWHYGVWPSDQVDHVDHDRSNNRVDNLRDVSNCENGRNQSRYVNNTSGATGVYWYAGRNKWRASISVNGKNRHLGIFNDVFSAISARKKAERAIGFHANHGKDAPV